MLSQNGKLLIQRPNSGRDPVVELGPFTGSFNAQAKGPLERVYTYGTNYYDRDPYSKVNGRTGLYAQFDDRRARLSRSGARGETFTSLGDGSILTEGHGRWSYTQRVDNSSDPLLPDFIDNPVMLSAVIGVQAPGSWSSNREHTWNPSDSRSRETSTVVDIPNGGALLNEGGKDRSNLVIVDVPPGWYRMPSSGTSPLVVDYTVTDKSDGAMAKAKYKLYLHDEFENLRAGGKPNQVSDTEFRIKQNGTLRWFPGPGKVGWNFGLTIAHGWKYAFTPTFKLGSWFTLGGSAEGNKTTTVVGNFTQTWDIAANRHVYAYVKFHQEMKHYLVDRYDEAGFVGAEDQWFEDGNARGIENRISNEYAFDDFTSRDSSNEGEATDATGNGVPPNA